MISGSRTASRVEQRPAKINDEADRTANPVQAVVKIAEIFAGCRFSSIQEVHCRFQERVGITEDLSHPRGCSLESVKSVKEIPLKTATHYVHPMRIVECA